MTPYFPSILPSAEFPEPDQSSLPFSVNSGKNAIRLLLRSYGLAKGSTVALPAYVCDSLKEAVLQEGFTPLYLDLKTDGTYWTDYNHPEINQHKVPAVILVHLYGFIHPDTEQIMEVCRKNKLFLLHDAAQSYGIDEFKLTYTSGLVYSFGPGKSSTAAGGAVVKGLDPEFYKKHVSAPPFYALQNLRSKQFLKSRVATHRSTSRDKVINRFLPRIPEDKGIRTMCSLQIRAATAAMELVHKLRNTRKSNYQMLVQALARHPLLKIAYDDGDGLYFKMVLSVEGGAGKFKTYLQEHHISCFSVMDAWHIGKTAIASLTHVLRQGDSFVELSTEACIPENELIYVAGVLSGYH
ncbi:MAG TPA: DegT/DnrJ/EryC1/StrS family aminotransferase [Bacteroidia bacterium]|jgi:dTDP-4-amino-4,6-dideoxygalactose transaminase|nr:DegT/DnrJ/EryC1/StrS family aminotransferase [Bacteroidia bacterium]